ncbi:MAG: hypothetical protein FJZ58_04190, partial [Chlamydiae bacterium]|nr:hypothetical protein [Chlamydiota bacterium]
MSLVCMSRDHLLARGASFLVQRELQQIDWQVQEVYVDGSSLVLQGLQGKTPWGHGDIQEVQIHWHLSFFPLRLEPRVSIIGPLISCYHKASTSEGSSFLKSLLGNTWYRPLVSVKEGKVLFPEQKRVCSFCLIPGTTEEEIGLLSLYDQEGSIELLTLELTREEKGLIGKGKMEGSPVKDLFPWLSLTSDIGEAQGAHGEVSALWTCYLGSGGECQKIEADLAVEGLDITTELDALCVKKLRGTLSFTPKQGTPLWQQLDLFLTFEEMSIMHGEEVSTLGLREALGEVRLHPTEDPYMRAQGILLSQEKEIPFSAEGRGELLDKEAYWLQMAAQFFTGEEESHVQISLCQDEEQKSVLEAECVGMTGALFHLVRSIYPLPFDLLEGKVGGKLLGHFERGQLKQLELIDGYANQLGVSLLESSSSAYIGSASFQAFIQAKTEGNIELQEALLEVHEGRLQVADCLLEQVVCKVEVTQGNIRPSYIEGVYEGIKACLQTTAGDAFPLFHLECGAYPQDVVRWLALKTPPSLSNPSPIYLVVDLGDKGGEARFEATLRLSPELGDREDIKIEGSLSKKMHSKFSTLWEGWDLSSLRGSFFVERFSQDTLRPFLSPWAQELTKHQVEGTVRGLFDHQAMQVAIAIEDLTLEKGSLLMQGPLGEKEPIRLSYSFGKKEWEGVIPIQKLLLTDSSYGISATLVDSSFFYKEGRWYTDLWTLQGQGYTLTGDAFLTECVCKLTATAVQGNVESLTSFLGGWQGISGVCIQGNLSAEGVKDKEAWKWRWALALPLQELAWSSPAWGDVKSGRARLLMDSSGKIELQDVQATYQKERLTCQVTCPSFQYVKGRGGAFSLYIENRSSEIASLSGQFQENVQGVDIYCSQVTFLGTSWDIDPVYLRQGKIQNPLIVKGKLGGEGVRTSWVLAEKMGWSLGELPPLQGELKIQASYDPTYTLWKARIESPQLGWGQKTLGKIDCQFQGKGSELDCIEACIGSWVAKGKVLFTESAWKIPHLSLTSQDIQLTAQGNYHPKKKKVQLTAFSCLAHTARGDLLAKGSLEGDLTAQKAEGSCSLQMKLEGKTPLVAATTKDVAFYIEGQRGIQIEKSRWDLISLRNQQPLAAGTVQEASYLLQGGVLQLQGVQLSLKPESMHLLLPKPLVSIYEGKEPKISLQASLSQEGLRIFGSLSDGSYRWKETALPLKELQFLLEEGAQTSLMTLQGKTIWKKEPLWLEVRTSLVNRTQTFLVIKDHPEAKGLALQLSESSAGTIFLEKGKGSLLGVDLQVQKRPGSLTELCYDVSIQADFSKTRTLFSKEVEEFCKKWQLGAGYSYQGTLRLSSDHKLLGLQGECKGERMGLCGKTWQSMHANISLE